MEKVIYNGHIISPVEGSEGFVAGTAMKDLREIKNGWIRISGERIAELGDGPCPELNYDERIDAGGGLVLPSFCDSHTHLVFAGSREREFEDKIRGLSYEEIARRGGGILNSADLLHKTSEADLFTQAWNRIEEIKRTGTGAVEIKSGYGLSPEDELKMLRVIKRIRDEAGIEVRRTFLGAHAVPAAYKGRQKDYVDLVIREMLPAVASERLAEYVDVFCDRGFFTVEETEQILEAASGYGLIPKIHANELDKSGGIQAGVKFMARSVDHLEYTGKDEIAALLNSGTMATVLPGASFFLGLPYAPARNMIDSGLALALASDFNPGSSPSGNMLFMFSLACIKLKMLPAEALTALTINGAYAMGLEKDLGSLKEGKKASLFITKPLNDLASIPYYYGSNPIKKIFIRGSEV